MRPRTLLILASVVAALGAVIWFWERDLPSSEERTALAKRVVSIDVESVDAVRVTRAGETLVLRREASEPAGEGAPDASTWVLEEPLRARADGAISHLGRPAAAAVAGTPYAPAAAPGVDRVH